MDVWLRRFLERDQRGRVHKSIVYPAILKEFGGNEALASALLADYKKRSCLHAQAFSGMNETLAALRERGMKLAIVTNGETDVQKANIRALELQSRVDAILISQEEGLRKPDVALFHRATARLSVPPEQCLFVGDNPETDIVGAHRAGMATAWFDKEGAWPLTEPRPHHIIKRLSEIPALLG